MSPMRPDFERTMTGYRWLDWTLAPILNPYNAIVGWIYQRRLDHLIGIYGTTKERRARFREVFEAAAAAYHEGTKNDDA